MPRPIPLFAHVLLFMKNRPGSYARPRGNHTGNGVFLPSNRFQRPHAAGTSGLTSLGLLAPFVLSDLSGGILDCGKPWSVDILVIGKLRFWSGNEGEDGRERVYRTPQLAQVCFWIWRLRRPHLSSVLVDCPEVFGINSWRTNLRQRV